MDVVIQCLNPSSLFSQVTVVVIVVIIRGLYSQYVFTLTNVYHFFASSFLLAIQVFLLRSVSLF